MFTGKTHELSTGPWLQVRKLSQSLPEGITPLNPIKPAFSYGFPMVSLRFDVVFPMGSAIPRASGHSSASLEAQWWRGRSALRLAPDAPKLPSPNKMHISHKCI